MDPTPSTNGASAADDPYVGEYPGVCGGYPVIRDTRIPVWVIVELNRKYYSVEQLAELYPHIGQERIQGALDYYDKHPARVDEDIARNDRAWSEIVERNVPIQGRPWPA